MSHYRSIITFAAALGSLGTPDAVSGATVRVEMVASALTHSFSPPITVTTPDYTITFPASGSDTVTFAPPTAGWIVGAGEITQFEFLLTAPAGQFFLFEALNLYTLVFSLDFALAPAYSVAFSNQVEASVLGIDGASVISFQAGPNWGGGSGESFSLFGTAEPGSSLAFSGISIKVDAQVPPAGPPLSGRPGTAPTSGELVLESASFGVALRSYYGDEDPGPALALVPEPGRSTYSMAAVFALLARRRR